jgi:probable HAF family extracellular repeat protein
MTHGFLLVGSVFTSLNFPVATATTAWGINDNGEIAGVYTDTASLTHGFIYSNNAWSRIDVAGATDTALHRIKNNGIIAGDYTDDLTEVHAIKGQ